MNPSPVTVLIVDDDPVFTRFARQLIQSLGADLPCVVQCADTAGKARAEPSQHAYDLVLLDYNLPDQDGLQLLAEIRKLAPPRQPAVIMLTASGNEAIAVEAMKRGAKDYLTKADLDLPPLMRAMQTALAQKRLADQVAAFNAQMEADLKMARNLQQSLLPDRYPVFPCASAPEKSALQFCHRFFPASQLAGDFFSVLSLSETKAGVFICDVMGHGVRLGAGHRHAARAGGRSCAANGRPRRFSRRNQPPACGHVQAGGRNAFRHGFLPARGF